MTAGRGWAYAGVILGAVLSVAGNVGHARVPPPGSGPSWTPSAAAQAMAAAWPVLVLVAVEVLTRVEWPAGARWVAVRWAGLVPVAGVAAVASYAHLSALLVHLGDGPVVARTGPLAVDGLMVLSAGALLATGRRSGPAVQSADQPDRADRAGDVDGPRVALVPDQTADQPGQTADRPGTGDDLLPVARTVAEQLSAEGRRLSRRALVEGIRASGHTCSTDRATTLLAALGQ